tara:strand:- start:135 stop:299 length:165 start_codon:yes stop_codon:yes gene_type:complete
LGFLQIKVVLGVLVVDFQLLLVLQDKTVEEFIIFLVEEAELVEIIQMELVVRVA